MTITIVWPDGTSTTFNECTITSDTDTRLKFNGKKEGTSTKLDFDVTKSSFRYFSK